MDKAKKKRIKRYLIWAVMALVVALLTVMPLLAKNEAEKDGPQASVLSAQVQTGSIETQLRGGGNLESVDAEDVNIPAGVKITGFLVKNGDVVQEGMPLATVDKVSVMEAITSVGETMKYLRKELEDSRNEKIDEKVKAAPGGRVKRIFAREGESVQEVMLRDGALAVLSIDGLMAVRVETPSDLQTGATVTVILSNGTKAEGRVESNLDGQVTVTVEDEGYTAGQTVMVEGLGSGTLYIHNAWKATAYSGTISKVSAREEQTLSEGADLFVLSDREFTGQLQHRANQHREYEELMQRLLVMYESGTIDAPCEGVVSGVDENSAYLLAAENASWEVSLLGGTQAPKYRIVFLSGPEVCTGLADCTAAQHDRENHECINNQSETVPCPATENHQDTCISLCKHADQEAACNAKTHYKDCIRRCTHAANAADCDASKHYPDCIHKCEPSLGTNCPATVHHQLNCIGSCTHGNTETDCPATGKHHMDCVHSCTEVESCPASKHKTTCFFHDMVFVAYPAKVTAVGTGALVAYASNQVYYVEKSGSGWVLSNGAKLDESLMVNQTTIPTANAKAFQEGDVILVVTGESGSQKWSGIELYRRTATPGFTMPDFDLSGMMGGMNFDLSGLMGGFAGYGNYAVPSAGETENLHDLKGSTLLTVTPRKSMKLTIALDQQDIAKVTPGMTAQVKVEALKGQVFQAEVTKVGANGTNNGGSSKFPVELKLEAREDMLSGMSATASIPLETLENVLLIPLAAVEEQDGKTLVYTARDKDSQEPSLPVEVVTGVSDGEMVQIFSGLSQGDAVYYLYYDTLELDTSAKADRFTLG